MSDTISRQAAIDATWFEPSYTDPLNVLTEVRDRLKALPSAKEDEELGEWVYEERKRLDDETDDGPVYVTEKWWTCSKCGFAKGFMVQKPSERYCPMCGDKKKR